MWTEIEQRPAFQASMQLACGVIARVTVLDGEILADFRDHQGNAVTARMTGDEADEFATMLRQANRCVRGW